MASPRRRPWKQAENKPALADGPYGAEFVTVFGTRGGSAIAAAAVNALSLAAKAD